MGGTVANHLFALYIILTMSSNPTANASPMALYNQKAFYHQEAFFQQNSLISTITESLSVSHLDYIMLHVAQLLNYYLSNRRQ